ncbi:tail fiber domain-containing protein [Limnovirga soli]|uniref:Peptidase S74 domain-containing protein n=1 Tax=Limnovirga soli TaxID=2656915 RepID=A0A8J8FFU1_9BACT|nr:tail fiber domain-containing protein [Limnovirga soli]NNV57118.1 hypothetical protein [Limnovirga soli]
MKRIALPLLFLTAGYIGAKAQNTFPATGRTGIYTTTPAASLQVKGGARIGTLTNYTNIDSTTGNLSFGGNALYQVGNNKFAFQSASQPSAGLFFNATNLRYEFRNTAGVSVLNLGAGASNNFLGIGNTTPITQLANTSSNIIGSDFNGVSPNSIAWATNADGFTVATYNANAGVKGNGLAVKIAGNSGRLLDLSVGATQNGAGTSVMVVNGNGNVGIGTSAPVTTLDVKESGWFRNNPGGLLAPSAGAGLRLTTENNIASIFGYDYSTNTALNLLLAGSGGNVGIGPGIPTAPLQIANAATSGNKRIVMYQDVDNDNEFYGFGINANQIRYQVDAVVSDHVFFAGTSPTTSNELMRIKGTGLVGIGTSAPAAKLDIAGNIKITDGTEGAGKLLTSDANGLASWTAAPSASPFIISGNDIYNSNTGNIGIGTATPAAKLDVNGDALINGITVGRGLSNSLTNTAIGYANLAYNNTGNYYNTAIGFAALAYNGSGYYNTANGAQALVNNSSGYYNTANGFQALYNNTIGTYNTSIGLFSDVASGALTNATAIGANATVDASNKVRIGSPNVTSIGGQVSWTTFSDGRYKKNIKEDVKGLAFINSLKPITYTVDLKGLDAYFDNNRKHDSAYEQIKKDIKPGVDEASKIVYNGFIAQEVEAAAKKLNYDFSGVDKPKSKDGLYGLRYSDFVVPLVKAVQELSSQNEKLKTENEGQQKVNADLQKQIDDLKAMITKGNAASQSEVSNNQTAAESNAASLKQNAPNPFSRSTFISFSLPKQYTNAQILITDMTGKTIKQANVSGSNSLTVAAGSLASGSYKYSLVVDGKIMGTKTMVLTR